jgi:hypothetical protein
MCAAISNIYSCSEWASEEFISGISSDARSVGVRNVSARLSLYRGAKACAEGTLELARLYFLEAGQIALLSGDLWLEALANNNLAVVSYVDGDKERANIEIDRVLVSVERLIGEIPTENDFFDLISLSRKRADFIQPTSSPLERNMQLPLLPQAPRCCGTLNVLLYNLEEFGKINEGGDISQFWLPRKKIVNSSLGVLQSTSHPLVVYHDGRIFVLTVE